MIGGRQRQEGFTLLEMVITLSVFSAAGLFFTGFMLKSTAFLEKSARQARAGEISAEAARHLEEELRYGFGFRAAGEQNEKLAFRIRENHGSEADYGSEADRERYLDPSELYGRQDGYELVFDFGDTTESQVRAVITVFWEEEVLGRRRTVITSMYGEKAPQGSPDSQIEEEVEDDW